MIQFLSINFFSWISSIFVGYFKSSRFLCHSVLNSKYKYGNMKCISVNMSRTRLKLINIDV